MSQTAQWQESSHRAMRSILSIDFEPPNVYYPLLGLRSPPFSRTFLRIQPIAHRSGTLRFHSGYQEDGERILCLFVCCVVLGLKPRAMHRPKKPSTTDISSPWYSSGWPRTHNPPASACQMLGLRVCVTMSGSEKGVVFNPIQYLDSERRQQSSHVGKKKKKKSDYQ